MINIAICEDNVDEIKVIQNYVREYMDNKKIEYTIGLFMCGEQLLESKVSFDILFLDILMGDGMNGIIAGEKMKSISRKVNIIYVTSFSQYWKDAVNSVHAFAYLEKPILKEDLELQIEAALHLFKEQNQEKQSVTFEILEIVNGVLETKIKKFKIDEIYYFEYLNRKICIKTTSGTFYFIDQMKYVIEKMKEYKFESCHQSFLINLAYVQYIKGYDLYLSIGEKLHISQKKSNNFRLKLNRFIQNSI